MMNTRLPPRRRDAENFVSDCVPPFTDIRWHQPEHEKFRQISAPLRLGNTFPSFPTEYIHVLVCDNFVS